MKAYLQRHVWWRVSLLYIALSLLVTGGFTHQAHSEDLISKAHLAPSSSRTTNLIIQGSPSRIIIPSVSLDIKVVPGTYDSRQQTWSVSDVAANFATNTYKPNNKAGTTLIYGHDRQALFHKIKQLKKGDTVTVYTDGGYIFTYQYDEGSSRDLQPHDTTIFSNLNSNRPKLLLLTCDGLWSQHRWVVSFSLKEAK